MKKAILLILGVFSAEFAFSQKGEQTLGIQFGASALKVKQVGINNKYESKVFPLGGIYYDYAFSKRLGISTGLQVRTFEEKQVYRFFDYSPFHGKNKLQYTHLDIPINLMVNLSFLETQAWKPYLLVGYNYSRLIYRKTTNFHSGAISKGFTDFNSVWQGHYLHAGLEVRHALSEKFMLAINPGFCLDLNSGNYYNEQHQSFLYLKLKFGRSWNRN
ncbi:outer membrane beta-barrel protein [Adhaeribacter sp. BT258]|uniref:Outer membrane beta-barrel protein n=1 Tax=Adhaeribacter terrigena TaxID=2793070 RepID=A0ABS1C625_9BACT|nr:outer membrane beta-barrel protein [Adhaeribacter terrigena]MBK0404768.1 outer membrane beta-barrel protein [Adhaeribacter terrigena]